MTGGAPAAPAATAVAVNEPARNPVNLPSVYDPAPRGKLTRTNASGIGLPAPSYAVILSSTDSPVRSESLAGSATSFATGVAAV